MDEKPALTGEPDGSKLLAEAAIKYRRYPTPQQWIKMREAFDVVTWTYIKCVEALNTRLVKANKRDLRNVLS